MVIPLTPVCLQSVPDVVSGSQYNNVNTPSYIQCNGVNGDHQNNFEFLLSTNTAITKCLEAGKFYAIMGKLITTNDGSPPVITYNQNSPAVLSMAKGAELDMINCVGIVGLGHVVSATEVASGVANDSTRLEVIVAHNDWDS
jgi:hypothetical protein